MKLRGKAEGRRLLQLKAATLVWLWIAAACGGQSGAEGRNPRPGSEWPGPGSSCADADVDELPFEPSWIEGLANGRHESTSGWRDPGLGEVPAAAGSQSVVLEVTQRSEIQTSLKCGGMSRYDADVEIQYSKARRATFKGQVFGSRSGAFLNASASTGVAKTLELPGSALTGEDGPSYKVFAQFDDDGMRGDLDFYAGSTGECAKAAWPADRTCSLSERELPADTAFGDFRFGDVLAALQQMSSHEVRWKDNSTTSIVLSVEESDSPICVGKYFSDRLEDGTQLQRLSHRVTAHVRTEDGRLDVSIPAVLSVRWSETGGVAVMPLGEYNPVDSTIQLGARAIGRLTPESHADSADSLRFDVLEINVVYGPTAVAGTVYLSSLTLSEVPAAFTDPEAPARSMQNGECLGIRGGEPGSMGTFQTTVVADP